MSKSIKINFIFNIINTVSSLLFPLITFPYVSRILMPEGVGLVNFYQSIIQYIVLLSSLGIPMYAIRETAKYRDDYKKCSITTLEILTLHFLLTFIGYLIVFILCFTVPEVKDNLPLFLILSIQLFMMVVGCEWFYQGIEEFKYITIRSIVTKTLAVIFLFIFVRNREDIILYGIYSVLGVYSGNIFNFLRLRRFIDLSYVKDIKPFRHLKPALKIFVLNLIVSLYVNLNSVMLGFMKDAESVGFFSSATKITQLLLGITSALGTVMLPRLSNLVVKKDFAEFSRLSNVSAKLMFALTLPLSIAVIFLADNFITLFCGEAYMPSIPVLQIISFIIFAIGLSGVIGIQMLYPLGRENIVIISTAVGAALNLILNIILIPQYAYIGAGISTLIAEVGVALTMIVIGKKYLPIVWKDKSYLNYIIASILMGIVLYLISLLELDLVANLCTSFIVAVLVYGFYLKTVGDSMYKTIIENFKNKLCIKVIK